MKIHGKSYSFLIEMLLVILFFSICAVITLQFFVKAYEKSELSKEQNKALMCVQSEVEYLRSLDKKKIVNMSALDGIKYFDESFKPVETQDNGRYIITVDIENEQRMAGDMVKGTVVLYKLVQDNNSSHEDIQKSEIISLDTLIYFPK